MKFKYTLEGLDCANCAEKMQSAIAKLHYVQTVVITFADKRLRVEMNDDDELRFLAEAQKIVSGYEQNCRIVQEEDAFADINVHNNYSMHHHHHENKNQLYNIIGVTAVGVFLLSLLFKGQIRLVLEIASYCAIVWPILLEAYNNIKSGDIFDENFLLIVASLGAMLLGDTPEAIEVLALFRIGKFFEDRAITRSRRSISALATMRPDKAHISLNGAWIDAKPESVKTGDIIQVRTGERVPLDGEITAGEGVVDKSAITGESKPEFIESGNEIVSGSVLINGLLEVRVTRPYSQSTVARILDMVENAPANKADTERFISKFAKIYTPFVIGCAFIVAFIVPLVLGDLGNIRTWLKYSLNFLVISCPCAIVISIPLCYFAGIGQAARKGILFKGAYVLERLRKCNTAVFDKTGTLTDGSLKLLEVKAAEGFDSENILALASALEKNSNHPIAKAIAIADTQKYEVVDYKDTIGKGISGIVEGKSVFVGSRRFLEENGIVAPDYSGIFAAQYVAIENQYAGVILLQDTVKQGAAKAFAELRHRGINRLSILSGDQRQAVETVAKEVGADEAAYELLPEQKVEQLARLTRNASVIYTGDGINDAPVLVRADVGVSMGQLGSDIAIEASDIVLMRDDLSLLPTAIDIARSVRKRVVEALTFALCVKLIVMIMSVLGYAPLWLAVFADTGVTIICVLNALRVRVK